MILFVPALGIAREEAEPEKLVNLRESWTKAKGVGARPIKEGYLTSLINLRENFTKSNRLEGALLVREEIEILTQGKARDPEDDNTKGPTQLLELRKSYQREMARLTATKDRIYLGALDKMQRRFSGQGQLEAAVAVKAEIDKVRSEGIVPKKAVAFGGHRYLFFDVEVSWDEAKERCEKLEGHLVAITSRAEQKFVAELALAGKGKARAALWIGYTDREKEGKWKWITGEKSGFSYWAAGEPNNSSAGEHCCEMWLDSGGKWNDVGGNDYEQGFVCEWGL